jgi:hypothetical protein
MPWELIIDMPVSVKLSFSIQPNSPFLCCFYCHNCQYNRYIVIYLRLLVLEDQGWVVQNSVSTILALNQLDTEGLNAKIN